MCHKASSLTNVMFSGSLAPTLEQPEVFAKSGTHAHTRGNGEEIFFIEFWLRKFGMHCYVE